MRRNGWLVAIAVAAAVSFACSSTASDAAPTSGPTRLAGVPVLAQAISRPESALPRGLKVPPGSVLVGAPVPTGPTIVYKGKTIADHGWEAFLIITGQPSTVVLSFLRQVANLGYVTSTGECRHRGSAGFCEAGGSRGPAEDRRYLTLTINRGPADNESRFPASLGVIRYRDEDSYPGLSSSTAQVAGAFDIHGADVPMPTGWAPLATAGQSIGEDQYDTPAIRLPVGTALAMPLMPYNCIAGQYRALIKVTGRPFASFKSLRSQLLSHPHDGSPATTVLHELGRRTYQINVTAGGAWSFEARMTMVSASVGWLVFETCYD